MKEGGKMLFARLVGNTITIPTPVKSQLDQPIHKVAQTLAGFLNSFTQLGLIVAILGVIFSGIFIAIESHKSNNLSQMNRGHRLLVGCIVAAVIFGGATAIMTAAVNAGGGIF